MNSTQMDFAILETLKRRPYSIMVLYPTMIPLSEELHREVYQDLIYEKVFDSWTPQFSANFVEILYYIERHRKPFTQGPLRILFLAYKPEWELRVLKDKVRAYYNVGYNSAHSCDTQAEANFVLGILNPNTVVYLSSAPSLHINFPNFNRLFVELLTYCAANRIDTDSICIGEEAVLSVYSMKDCQTMTVFTDDATKFTGSAFNVKVRPDIVRGPACHFYFLTIKFCNLMQRPAVIYRGPWYRLPCEPEYDRRLFDAIISTRPGN
jgi:hypothetical protein